MEGSNPIIENALRELERLEREPPKVTFAHSFVTGSIDAVLRALVTVLPDRLPRVPGVFTSTPRLGGPRAVFFAPASSGVILWHEQSLLSADLALSSILRQKVHWIAVYEEMRWRAYAQFDCGILQKLLADPEPLIRESMVSGDELMGRGPRTFASLDAFFQAVADMYRPIDTVWDFHMWNDNGERTASIESGASQFSRCIKLSFLDGRLVLEPIGAWQADERAALQLLLTG